MLEERFKKCPECKKEFVITTFEQWGYKHKGKLYCSWTCLRSVQKKAKKSKAAKRREKSISEELHG